MLILVKLMDLRPPSWFSTSSHLFTYSLLGSLFWVLLLLNTDKSSIDESEASSSSLALWGSKVLSPFGFCGASAELAQSYGYKQKGKSYMHKHYHKGQHESHHHHYHHHYHKHQHEHGHKHKHGHGHKHGHKHGHGHQHKHGHGHGHKHGHDHGHAHRHGHDHKHGHNHGHQHGHGHKSSHAHAHNHKHKNYHYNYHKGGHHYDDDGLRQMPYQNQQSPNPQTQTDANGLPPGWDYDHKEDLGNYNGGGNYNDNQYEYEREGQMGQQGQNEGGGDGGGFQEGPGPQEQSYQEDQPNILINGVSFPKVQMPRIPQVSGQQPQIGQQWVQAELLSQNRNLLLNDSPMPTRGSNGNLNFSSSNNRHIGGNLRQTGIPLRRGQMHRTLRQFRRLM